MNKKPEEKIKVKVTMQEGVVSELITNTHAIELIGDDSVGALSVAITVCLVGIMGEQDSDVFEVLMGAMAGLNVLKKPGENELVLVEAMQRYWNYIKNKKEKDIENQSIYNTPIPQFLEDSQIAGSVLVRIINCLESVKIETLGQLLQMTPRDLKQIRCMGDTCIKEIQQALAKKALYLKSGNKNS